MKKTFLAIIGALLLLVGLYFLRDYYWNLKQPVPAPVAFTEIANGKLSKLPSVPTSPSNLSSPLPPELNLKMTFYTQAPYANWDYPWQEACEEASILLVANVYQEKKWTREQFNNEILKMVEWENQRFGDYWHTTMEQTKEILEDYLGLKAVIHDNSSLDDMKRILTKGHFIILPLDGKTLKNPYFTNGGPVYHVVPVKGYTEDNGIITHDVGTRRGEDYVYTWQTIDASWHDYAIPMTKGERVLLEVLPPGDGTKGMNGTEGMKDK